jgi:hypothetical protein
LPEYAAYTDLKGDGRYRQITARMALSLSIQGLELPQPKKVE